MSIREFGVMGLFPDEVIAKNEMKIRRANPSPAKPYSPVRNDNIFTNDYRKQKSTRKENAK